jgi:hypothetical protein
MRLKTLILEECAKRNNANGGDMDALHMEVSDSPACNLLSLEHPAASCHSAYDSFPLLYTRVSAITSSSLPVVVCSLCDISFKDILIITASCFKTL